MGVKAGEAENSYWAKRSTQGQAAEGAILKAQVLQGLASGRKSVVPLPVRDIQRQFLLVDPPIGCFFHWNIGRRKLPRANGVPQHFACALFKDDEIHEIKVQQWTDQRTKTLVNSPGSGKPEKGRGAITLRTILPVPQALATGAQGAGR